jgi:hypothetical protein
LKEPFWFGPDHLVKEVATFVGVVLFGNYPAMLTLFLFGPESTSDKSSDDGALFTPGVAVDQNLAVGIPETEGWVPVVMSWAASQPTRTRLSPMEVPSDFSSIHSSPVD